MVLRKKQEAEEPPDHSNLRKLVEWELVDAAIRPKTDRLIVENAEDVRYFAKLVHDRPEDAVRALMWQTHAHSVLAAEIRLREFARADYEMLSTEEKAKIDAVLANHPPRERERVLMFIMMTGKPGPAPSEGMGMSSG